MTTKHVNLFTAYRLFFKNYFNFMDNSSRSEYWWSFFCNWLIRIVLLIWTLVNYLKGQRDAATVSLVILGLFCLVVLIPCMSLTVRRYRNAGINVYWIIFTYLLPYFLITMINEFMGESLNQLIIWNGCALLDFICLVCAVILPMFPTKLSK